MKKILILIFIAQIAYSQNNLSEPFIGKWKVVNSFSTGLNQAVSDETELSQIFLGCSIDFDSDSNFRIDFKSQNEFALELIEMVAGTKWIYNKSMDWIMVGTAEDDYTIIGFQYFVKDNKSYLRIPESGIILEIEKIK